MKNLIYIITISLFIFSCSEENHELNTTVENQKVKSFEDYLKFMTANTDNRIILQSMSSINSTNNTFKISTTSRVNKELEFSIDNKTFKDENIYKGAFGNN